jgi:hypothetical protein
MAETHVHNRTALNQKIFVRNIAPPIREIYSGLLNREARAASRKLEERHEHVWQTFDVAQV